MPKISDHTYKQFNVELEQVRSGVLKMGGQVEQQLVSALRGLQTGDLVLLENVIRGDHEINRLEIELDEECNHIIAKRQPAAIDLRLVMTVVKSISDLERIGDEAKKIAKAARRLHSGETTYTPRVDLGPAFSRAVEMLRNALDCFARGEAPDMDAVKHQDEEVDGRFKAIMRQLITFMMEDPRTISSSLEMLFIAKSIERVGDHAKNIAEYLVFLVEGADSRKEKSVKEVAKRGG